MTHASWASTSGLAKILHLFVECSEKNQISIITILSVLRLGTAASDHRLLSASWLFEGRGVEGSKEMGLGVRVQGPSPHPHGQSA